MSWNKPGYSTRPKNNCVSNTHKRYTNYNQCAAASNNCWISYVRNYQSQHPGMSWGEALQRASSSYRSNNPRGNLRQMCVRGQRKQPRPKTVRY